ncbi:efflux RND transporter periplasmic adaptor subunit [Amaricoccus solimangrovi]|uniref:Efflux RND transporter periplasmic adaptor subunit n=1 Tax=Amaricoccus solimangrovi TaxID=2589815 RepID=A0A501WGE1_9RHOB|nr:efflux RND transporter periplasmic adaptor subunit [Amaricoccus solimangrovi]TPE47862.1 efflux RND transporter periplasmic adaptor subunit [Amaricoccus solimangrovi]
MLTRVVPILALLLAAAAAFVLLSSPRAVEVVPARRGTAAEVVYATGTVEPVTWAKVAPLVQARIVELCGCEGATVAKDQVLARLDARSAEAVIAELQARQDYLTREWDRLRRLAERDIATRADLERAESEAAQVEAAIAGARTRLENYVLRAPTDGVVLRQEGEVGEIADPGEALYWVGQIAPLRVVAEVNEEDIPRVTPGQRTLLAADAFPDRRLEAEVASVTPMGDPVNKTYRVRFTLPADTPLMIGMSVEVNVIVREEKDALLVPTGAVDASGAVWVVEEGVARRREVTLGIRGTTEVAVTEGLDEGVAVITPAPSDLAEGAHVEVRQ